MPQQIVIAEHLRIAALLTDERIDELIVAQGSYQIGDIFLGTIENVLPGIDAAFVNIGESEKNGFIHVSDLGPLRLKKNSGGITELLEPKQKVLVQVIKEPTGNKGPRLTGNIALPGRYLVLQPNGQGVNISRRINTEAERNRLRAIGVLIKPPGTGLLIRTEAESINEDLLIDDLENLLKQWDSIQQTAETTSPPSLLNRDEDFINKILRDHINPDLIRIIVETESAVQRVKEFLGKEGSNILVECHKQENNLLQHYKINVAINNALQPRVELPSGGYIIIEPTEALTVIDVNSGSFTRSSNSRETVLWTNCEAAKEIARQLKLRNIGGIIVIDFIDMDSRKDQLHLLEQFSSSIQNDSARPQIAQLTELGLLELTRKRQGQNIYELFGKPSQNSYGLGHLPIIPDNNQKLTTFNAAIETTPLINKQTKDLDSASNLQDNVNLLTNDITESTSLNTNNTTLEIENSHELHTTINEKTTSEVNINRQKLEVITVKIEEEEEEVYSNLGLNPKLLIEDKQMSENVMVHIIRPGEKNEEIIKKAKEQLSINSNRQRKKGRYSSRLQNKSEIEIHTSFNEENLINPSSNEDVANENISLAPSIKEHNNAPEKEPDSTELSNSIDAEQEPRRKRRRSSASS